MRDSMQDDMKESKLLANNVEKLAKKNSGEPHGFDTEARKLAHEAWERHEKSEADKHKKLVAAEEKKLRQGKP
jgi:hypothetical protein